MPRLFALIAALAALAPAACSNITVEDPHADAPTRMAGVAARLDQDRRQGGMAGAIEDIQNCYRDATVPVTKIYALRDCIVLDYAAFHIDVTVGRRLGPPLPFFEDQTFAARADHYAQLDGFTNPNQLAQYLRDAEAVVSTDTAQLHQGPVVIHHPYGMPMAKHWP